MEIWLRKLLKGYYQVFQRKLFGILIELPTTYFKIGIIKNLGDFWYYSILPWTKKILGLWTWGGSAEETKLYYDLLKLIQFLFRRQQSTQAVLIHNSAVQPFISCLAIERLECNIQRGGTVNAQNTTISLTGLHNAVSQFTKQCVFPNLSFHILNRNRKRKGRERQINRAK